MLRSSRCVQRKRFSQPQHFAADALQGDMGLTSPLRQHEVPNAEGVLDDARPGVDRGTGQGRGP